MLDMNNIKPPPFQTAIHTVLAGLYKRRKTLEKPILRDIPCNQDLQSSGQYLNFRQTEISHYTAVCKYIHTAVVSCKQREQHPRI